MISILILLILPIIALGNPFSPYIIVKSEPREYFHEIKRPFIYPFEQSFDVQTGSFDVLSFTKSQDGNLLNHLEEKYKDFSFDQKTSVYAYPFAIHPEWEILPYPYVGGIQGSDPKLWVEEFKIESDKNEGVRSFAFQERLNELTGTKAYAGNKVHLLKTPSHMEEIYRRVADSKKHIFITSFMFQCDLGMEKLLNLLEQKVSEGVEVYLIYDQKFSLANISCKKRLKRMGIKVALHHAKSPLFVFHEKMMVFDGTYGMILGHNMLASQVISTGTNNLINDMAIGVEGPMVGVIANRFLEHWSGILGKKMNPEIESFYAKLNLTNEQYASDESVKEGLEQGRGVCRLVNKGPGKKNKQISQLYTETVKATKNYLFFNMIDVAFRKPHGKKTNEKFINEVVQRANTTPGLRVDMLTNNWKLPTDVETTNGQGISQNLFSKISVALGRIVTKRPHTEIPKTQKSLNSVLTSENFHWWSYSQYMHGKTLMSDNIFSLVGSYNINSTSEAQSFEQVMACVDSELAQEFQQSIVIDTLNSIPVPLLKP